MICKVCSQGVQGAEQGSQQVLLDVLYEETPQRPETKGTQEGGELHRMRHPVHRSSRQKDLWQYLPHPTPEATGGRDRIAIFCAPRFLRHLSGAS